MSWKIVKIGDILTESKIESVKPDPNKRITVRLNMKGVEKRPYETGVEGATKYFVRKAGQFIYGKQNLFKGAFGIIPPELNEFESSSDIPTFDVSKECLPEWLYYYLKQGNYYLSLESIATGTGSRRIQPSRFFEVEIPMPEIKEQKQIIRKCKLAENKYGVLAEELALQGIYLHQLRQAILQEAVQGKLTKQDPKDEPADELLQRIKAEKQKLIAEGKLKKEKPLPPITEDEAPFELPKGWIWCRLGDIILDLKYGTSQKCDYKKAKHVVLRIPNISNGLVDFTDLKFANLPIDEFENLKLYPDDILVIRSNGSENLVGRTAVFKGTDFDCAYAGYLVRIRLNKKIIYSSYIHMCLESTYARELIEYPLRTTSGVKNINSTEISNLLIPLCSFSEQERTVTKVEQLLQLVNQLEQQVQQSKEQASQLLQAVLKEAFTNKKQYEENDLMTMAAEL
jgi:type I restriction enzyme S subunit